MPITKDITGRRYGRLVAISFHHKKILPRSSSTFWVFDCDCGAVVVRQKQKVTSGATKSCGCYQREKATSDATTHGLANHPLWKKWQHIKSRCYNKNSPSYKFYGAKGVRMCDEWLNDFVSFYEWSIANGWEDGLQIDKDVKATEMGLEPNLYSPDRCTFVTSKTNNNNRSSNRFIEYMGTKMTIMQWSEASGIHHGTIRDRVESGWSLEKVFTD